MTSGANRLGWCTFVFCTAMTTVSAQQHHSYVADAKRECAAVFSQPEKPCASAEDEASYKRCIGKVVELTDAHFTRLFIAIRGIASQDDADATMKSRLPLLDNADAAWRQYRKNMCDLWAAGMAGGSGENAAADECVYKLDRTYAQQLSDAVYLKILAE